MTLPVENPSADKFGPPLPDSANPRPDRKRRRRLIVFGLIFVGALVRRWIHPSSERDGFYTALTVIIVFAAGAVDYAMRRHEQQQSEADNASTPPTHLTR